MSVERISSLREVAEIARSEKNFSYPLRDFLDGFYADPKPEKISEAPPLLINFVNDEGLADAYLAAVCDQLCRRYRFQRPSWIKGSGRALKKPYFAAKTHGLRMIYLQESPSAFRERNIFVSANTLSRV